MFEDSVQNSVVGIASRAGGPGELVVEDGSSLGLLKLFISLQLFGLFGILIMLVTVIFSRSTPRHAAWYSFAFSWIISTISYSLLFWSGRLTSPDLLPYNLCLIQSMMVYSAPPLTAGTTLGLVVQIWFLVRSIIRSPSRPGRVSPLILTATLILPYLIYVAILVGTLVIGWRDPGTVKRAGSGMYCSFSNKMPGRLSTLLCALILVPAVVLEVLICISLRRQWKMFSRATYAKSMALRVVVFAFLGILAIALSLVIFFIVDHGAPLNIILSIVPVSAVLVFGSQADLLGVWMFWKKPPVMTEDADEKQTDMIRTASTENRTTVIDIHP